MTYAVLTPDDEAVSYHYRLPLAVKKIQRAQQEGRWRVERCDPSSDRETYLPLSVEEREYVEGELGAGASRVADRLQLINASGFSERGIEEALASCSPALGLTRGEIERIVAAYLHASGLYEHEETNRELVGKAIAAKGEAQEWANECSRLQGEIVRLTDIIANAMPRGGVTVAASGAIYTNTSSGWTAGDPGDP